MSVYKYHFNDFSGEMFGQSYFFVLEDHVLAGCTFADEDDVLSLAGLFEENGSWAFGQVLGAEYDRHSIMVAARASHLNPVKYNLSLFAACSHFQ